MGRPAASLSAVTPDRGQAEPSDRERQPQIIQVVKEQRIAHTGGTTTFQREGFRSRSQMSSRLRHQTAPTSRALLHIHLSNVTMRTMLSNSFSTSGCFLVRWRRMASLAINLAR